MAVSDSSCMKTGQIQGPKKEQSHQEPHVVRTTLFKYLVRAAKHQKVDKSAVVTVSARLTDMPNT